ncbi:MAG: hypothetical protein A3I66_10175 [Burkholderiales bacterium RIFCSPLOWO2_02_FULL_57_36]|nr:MAG: hypothetical protein A3I66_10175 [Burkholderiales bacterium RIFCSPLOWO2_02_FULL_57_36]
MIYKIIGWLSIVAGLAIWISTVLDVFQGYVMMPNRYKGSFMVYLSENPRAFWMMLLVWVLAGAWFIWLGWKTARSESKA